MRKGMWEGGFVSCYLVLGEECSAAFQGERVSLLIGNCHRSDRIKEHMIENDGALVILR